MAKHTPAGLAVMEYASAVLQHLPLARGSVLAATLR